MASKIVDGARVLKGGRRDPSSSVYDPNLSTQKERNASFDAYSSASLRRNTDAQNQKLANANPARFDAAADRAGFGYITPAQLNNTQPPAQMPPAPPLTPTTPFDSSLSSLAKSLPEQAKLRREASQTNEEDAFQKYFDERLAAPTETEIRNRKEEQAGLQELEQSANQLSNDLTAEQERLRKEIERVETLPGLGGAQKAARIAELTRVSRREQADIAITQLAAQSKFDIAQKYVDRAVQEEKEAVDKKLTLYKEMVDRARVVADRDEEREFEIALRDRERAEELKVFEYKANLEQKLKQSDPLYQLSLKEKQLQIDKLQNPDPTGLSPEALERIQKLPIGAQEKLVNSTDTIRQLTRMQELVSQNDFVTLSNPTSEAGREFQRLATDVADKLARERTGAVIGKEELSAFKTIMGVSLFNRALAPADEVNAALGDMINKHENVRKLIDPTGEIVEYLGAGSTEDDYLNAVDQATGLGDPVGAYLNQFAQ